MLVESSVFSNSLKLGIQSKLPLAPEFILMKHNLLFSAVLLVFIGMAACTSSKKTTTAPTPTAPVTPPAEGGSVSDPWGNSNPMGSLELPKGVFAPSMADLAAIQPHFKDVTMEQLNEGFNLYTTGACINCHKAKNISRHPVSEWKPIIDDMAEKAQLNPSQKEAVYRYVIGIKAREGSK